MAWNRKNDVIEDVAITMVTVTLIEISLKEADEQRRISNESPPMTIGEDLGRTKDLRRQRVLTGATASAAPTMAKMASTKRKINEGRDKSEQRTRTRRVESSFLQTIKMDFNNSPEVGCRAFPPSWRPNRPSLSSWMTFARTNALWTVNKGRA